MNKIILASKSVVRKYILEKNGIGCVVEKSNIDEDPIKESLLKQGATPEIISKNLIFSKKNEGRFPELDEIYALLESST